MKRIFIKLGMTMGLLSSSLITYAYDFEVDGIRYTITSFTEYTCNIVGSSSDVDAHLLIPTTVTFNDRILKINAIEESSFYQNNSIVGVTIPKEITKVGAEAFANCANLEDVVFEGDLSQIGTKAFANCNNLKSIVFQGNVKNNCIGTYLFSGCSSLTSITFPNGIEEFPDGFLYSCSSLKDLQIPNSVTSLGAESFARCTGLTNLEFHDNITTIGKKIIDKCQLQNLTIGNGINAIYDLGDFSVERIVFRDSPIPLRLGEGNFKSRKTIYRSSGAVQERIDTLYGLFHNINVKECYIGRPLNSYSVSNIIVNRVPHSYTSEEPFDGNNSLQIVELGYNAKCDFKDCNGIESVKSESRYQIAFKNCISLKSARRSKNAGIIFFRDCSSLQEYNDPNGLSWSTYNNMREYIVSNGVESVTSFYDISNINSMIFLGPPPTCTIPENSQETPFTNTQYLNIHITVPIQYLDQYKTSYPWRNFWNLSSSDDLHGGDFSANGLSFEIISNDEVALVSHPIDLSGSVYLPNSVIHNDVEYDVVEIKDAFTGNKQLTHIYLPEGVRTIADYAFYGCNSLIYINLPETLEYIGNKSFSGCSSLKSLNIPASTKFIGSEAFLGCNALESLIIDDADSPLYISTGSYSSSDTYTGTVMGSGKKSYDGVYYYSGNFSETKLKHLYIGRDIDYPHFKRSQFKGKDSDITVDYLYKFDSPFYGLSNLNEVTIAQNVKQIGGIEEFTINYKLGDFNQVEIKPDLFRGCGIIKYFISLNSEAPDYLYVDENSLKYSELWIPEEAWKNSYINAYKWKDFKYVNTLKYDDRPHLNINEIELSPNESLQLHMLKINKEAFISDVVWSSDNSDVATVGSTGLIKASSGGSALIKCTIGDFEDFCRVTVINNGSNLHNVEDEIDSPHTIVYNLQGILILNTNRPEDITQLSSGTYIINGKKCFIP